MVSKTVRDIGEQELLQLLQQFCDRTLVGDDGAVFNLTPHHSLVVTTDVLVDGVHFSDQTTSPEDAGWRAAAANLSDLAAMGASPVGITVGLGLPPTVTLDWVTGLYQGLTQCLQRYNTLIVGGDICRSSTLTVAITAFGEVSPDRVLQRSRAKPGDAIVATGTHGNSRAGLELLINPEQGDTLNPKQRQFLIQTHQRPQPRLDVLPLLWETLQSSQEQGQEIAIAAMDSSDGLADAILQICRLSDVGAQINRLSVPISPVLHQFTTSEQALEWALYGGEDFELILCLPEVHAWGLVTKLGQGAAVIGKVTMDKTVELVDPHGNYPSQNLTLTKGFQHFKE